MQALQSKSSRRHNNQLQCDVHAFGVAAPELRRWAPSKSKGLVKRLVGSKSKKSCPPARGRTWHVTARTLAQC